jgi:predicted TIM-barrel fold metal-dependent hydrolase
MIWTNSGDSHLMEPEDLWTQRMPAELAERMPRSEKIDERTERVHIDGFTFERRMPISPIMSQQELEAAGLIARGREAGMEARDVFRPPGAYDPHIRLGDQDEEGVWGEVIYPSVGLWNGLIKDPALYREGVRVFNDYIKEEFLDLSPRFVPAAEVSIRTVEDAVAETNRVAGMGFKALNTPVALDPDLPPWYDEVWEPFWSTLEEAGIVVASHIGTEPQVMEGYGRTNFTHHGPGGAIRNYVEVSLPVQRFVAMLVGSGILDRHPALKILVSEGGATWVPFIADRMDEGYRQHGVYTRPKLSRLPSEIAYDQVYATFQHDKTCVAACVAAGYRNVLWGSDYPHMEGTFGHTQKTLHELFDDVDEQTRYRVTRGTFLELFPHVGEPPQAGAPPNG